MKNINRFLAAFLAALLLVSLSACAPNLGASAVTPKPEATTAPTPTLSPVPTEVPTPTVDEFGFTEERKAELNQQIQDFLNYRGDFAREKISEMMMEPATDLDISEISLGIVRSIPEIQGYFFDYFEKDNKLFMLMGFDGKDGTRFVTPVEIELYVYKQLSEASFGVFEYDINNFFENGNSEFKSYYGENQIISLLNNLKSKVIVLGLNTMEREEPSVDEIDQTVIVEGTKEINSKIELTFGLFQLVSSNNLTYDNPERGDTASIIKITSVDDAEKIDISKVPILLNMSYFKGILNTN